MNEPSFFDTTRFKLTTCWSKLDQQVSKYICSLMIVVSANLSAVPCDALEIDFNIAGNTQNKNIYGSAADPFTGGWGSNYYDFTFKLIAPSTVSFSNFSLQVNANKGNSTTTTLNASLFTGAIVASPSSGTLLGTTSINSSAVSTSYTQLFIGPSSTLSPNMTTAVNPGSQYFIRIWSTGGGAVTGFGIKIASDPQIQYSTSNGTVSMTYYDGTSFVTSSSFTPVPETSSMLMGGLATGCTLVVGMHKKRKARQKAQVA